MHLERGGQQKQIDDGVNLTRNTNLVVNVGFPSLLVGESCASATAQILLYETNGVPQSQTVESVFSKCCTWPWAVGNTQT